MSWLKLMIVLPQQWHVGSTPKLPAPRLIRLRLFSSSLIRLPPTRLLSCFFPLHACVKTFNFGTTGSMWQGRCPGGWLGKEGCTNWFDFIPNHSKCLVLMELIRAQFGARHRVWRLVLSFGRSGPVGSTPSLEDGEGHVTSSAELQLKPTVYLRDTVRHERYPLPHTRGAEIHPTGVLSCHEHMLMQQDWEKSHCYQALYANRLLGLRKRHNPSLCGWKTSGSLGKTEGFVDLGCNLLCNRVIFSNVLDC